MALAGGGPIVAGHAAQALLHRGGGGGGQHRGRHRGGTPAPRRAPRTLCRGGPPLRRLYANGLRVSVVTRCLPTQDPRAQWLKGRLLDSAGDMAQEMARRLVEEAMEFAVAELGGEDGRGFELEYEYER